MIRFLRCTTSVLLLTLASLPTHVGAEEWSQFRGPLGNGVSSETNLPTTWSGDKGVLWSTPLPGQGNSSPVLTKDRIFVTTATDRGLFVIGMDRKTGKIVSKTMAGNGQLAAKGPANLYAHRHNAATPTAVADDRYVWAFFGTGDLVCVDGKTGAISWKRDLTKAYGAYDITFGMGSSPRLFGDLLFVNCMTKGPAYVVALNKNTGEEVWKVSRELPAADDGPDAYSSPSIFKSADGYQLLVSGADHINAYEPTTGKQLWISSGLKIKSKFGRVIASPTAGNGVVVATSANPGGGGLGRIIALRHDKNSKGDVTKSHRLWTYPKRTADSSTPICVGDNLFQVTDKGIAVCLNLKTGEVQWEQRLKGGPYHASLVSGDGKVYFLATTGECTVMAASSKPKVLSVNKLEGTFYATPAISDGTIYLRAYERIYAIKP